MLESGIHSIPRRVVSLAQPWIRPIVRGKTHANTEFGAKLHISLVDGYARIERLDFEAYNESEGFWKAVYRFYDRYGRWILYELDDISYIPPDILKLFSAGGTDCLGAALFALGQSQKVTPGALAVHPRFLFPGAFADLVHCLFQLLPRLIEQIYSFRTERSEGIFAMF